MIKTLAILLILLNTTFLYSSEITFKWKKARWAKSYNFQISKDQNFYTLLYEFNDLIDTSYKVDLDPGDYYFHIAGINAAGLYGPYSKTAKIKVIKEKEQKVLYKPDFKERNKIVTYKAEDKERDTTVKLKAEDIKKNKIAIDEPQIKEKNIKGVDKPEIKEKSLSDEKPVDMKIDEKPVDMKIDLKPEIKTGKDELSMSIKSDYIIVPAGTGYKLTSKDDDVKKIFYSIDKSEYQVFQPDKPIIFNKDGLYKLNYYGIDFVGNTSFVKLASIRVDDVPPEVKMKLSGIKYINDGIYYIAPGTSVAFNAIDNVSEDSEIFISQNDGAFQDHKTIKFNFIESKTNIIKFYARDSVKNRSKVYDVKVVLDSTPPQLDYSFEGPYSLKTKDTYFIGKNTKIRIKAFDSILDNITVNIDGKESFTYNSPFSIDKSKAFVNITAQDKLNNIKKMGINIIKDDAPPVDTIIVK
ncbi:MAG: hypothetical protein KKH98_11110 [Spirochaetes bacterium]|nr:hypothetical protein [Spirochaetota bacterium]